MNLFSDSIKIQITTKYSTVKIAFIKYLFDMCYVPGTLLDIVVTVVKDPVPNVKESIV